MAEMNFLGYAASKLWFRGVKRARTRGIETSPWLGKKKEKGKNPF